MLLHSQVIIIIIIIIILQEHDIPFSCSQQQHLVPTANFTSFQLTLLISQNYIIFLYFLTLIFALPVKHLCSYGASCQREIHLLPQAIAVTVYRPTRRRSFQSCAHPTSRMNLHWITPWSCCCHCHSRFWISLMSCSIWNSSSQHCLDQFHHGILFSRPPVLLWCFDRMDKLVEWDRLWQGWACCGNTGLVCIAHTSGGHSSELRLCMPAQSRCNIIPTH